MSEGSNNPESIKFGSFLFPQYAKSKDSDWSHGTKVGLWIGLAVTSWGLLGVVAYLIWSMF